MESFSCNEFWEVKPIKRIVFFSMSLLLFFAVAGRCGAAEVSATVQAPVQEALSGQGVEPVGLAVSKDEALRIARDLFPELLAGKDLNAELADDYWEDVPVWQIGFQETAYSGGRTEYLDIALNAKTGKLKRMYYNGPSTGLEQGDVPITEETARQRAEAFAKKFCPAEFARSRLVERDYIYQPSGVLKNQYSFYWTRVEKGIPVLEEGISVGVDVFSGRLVNFNVNWRHDVVFPEPGVLPQGLESKIMRELGLYLCYQIAGSSRTGPGEVPEAALVYQLNSQGTLRINPGNGEAVTGEGETMPLNRYRRFINLPEPVAGGGVVTEPGPVAPAQKISQADAVRAAQEFFQKLGLEGEVTQIGGGSTGGGVFHDQFWSYSLREGEGGRSGQSRHGNVGINVYTGEVWNYNNSEFERSGPVSGLSPGIGRDAAREKALAFIRLVAPDKMGQVVEDRQDPANAGYNGFHHFSFSRLVNGIVFPQDKIIVEVGGDGTIVHYNCNWHRVRFPSAGEVIGMEEAEKIFLANNRLKFVYFFPLAGEELRPGKKPVPVLMFEPYNEWAIDACTGEPVILNQVVVQPKEKTGLEIPAGHWAAAPLSILASSGLLPAEGFEPDGPVSRREALRVLMSIPGRYGPDQQDSSIQVSFNDLNLNDPDYGLIQNAVRRGLLAGGGNFYPEQPILREDLAIWLVRALGYGEVAGMTVKIELKTADAGLVSDEAYNYAAIACGLGLFKGDQEGLLRPLEETTWAELAAVMTRAAPRLQDIKY